MTPGLEGKGRWIELGRRLVHNLQPCQSTSQVRSRRRATVLSAITKCGRAAAGAACLQDNNSRPATGQFHGHGHPNDARADHNDARHLPSRHQPVLPTITPSTPRVVVNGHAQDSRAKTRAGERLLALDPATRAALSAYVSTWHQERQLLGQDSDMLFVWPHGAPLHPETVTALFHKHCQAAGLPRIRLHDVRHSYASAALKAGIPAKVISERLGHSAVAFTMQTYTHVTPGMDRDAADTVADLILGSQPRPDGSNYGSIAGLGLVVESEEPADSADNRRSAGPSTSSGGRI